MSIEEVINLLETEGVTFQLDGEKVCIEYDEELRDELAPLFAFLRADREEVAIYLRNRDDPPADPGPCWHCGGTPQPCGCIACWVPGVGPGPCAWCKPSRQVQEFRQELLRREPAPASPAPSPTDSEPEEDRWPEASLDAERRFARPPAELAPHAKLFPFLGRKVRTPGGPGTLVQVFANRVTVILDTDLEHCSFFRPEEVRPVSWKL